MIDLDFFNSKLIFPSGILIRHSERNFIPNGVHDIVTPLNEIGKQKARSLGEKLRTYNKLLIYTSPVLRCVQTAEEISLGFNKPVSIETSNFLGEPGPFVYDSERAKEEFITKGVIPVVKHMQDSIKVEGIRNKEEGSQILLSFLKDAIQKISTEEFLIFISHDAIITVFLNSIFGEYFDESNWLDYLDGCGMIQKQDKLVFVRKEKFYEY